MTLSAVNIIDRPHFAFLDQEDPLAFAHQGGDLAGMDKRNTMVAFATAYALGYRIFETDAICSADGAVVACHGAGNAREERQWQVPQRSYLQGLTYHDMRRKHKVAGEEMPLLEEVLREWPDVRVNIDPKTEEAVLPLAKLLRDMKAVDRVCITSFRYARAKGVAEELGGQERVCTGLGPLGAIALKSRGLLLPGYLRHTKAACLQLPYQHVNEKMIDIAFCHGLDVHVWTPNEAKDMRKSLEQGVDGVMTDNVVALKEVMTDRGEWAEAA
jgi:glycerophosphoryl diester phosphodiesterase